MRYLLIITLTFIISTALSAKDLAVVISARCTIDSLNENEVKRIFLAKTYRINGKKIKVVELKDTDYKNEFYESVVHKTQDQLHSYWVTLIFTGKAKPPTQLESFDNLVSQINKDELIISYLPLSMVTSDMKVLYTLNN